MALTQLKTGAIADDAVTTDKLANAINTERTANTAKTTNATHTGDVTGSGSLTIADNAVTLAKMAGGTDGQIITYDASGDPVAVGPGTDGQVLTSTGAGSPPAFETIPSSGKILQTIMVEKTDTTSHSSGSTRTDISGITVNITPSATSSKILIMSTLNFCGIAGEYQFALYLMRGSTDLAIGDAASSRTRATIGGLTDTDNGYDMRPWHYTYLDSPNTTSQVTYKWQWEDTYHNQTMYLNRSYTDADGVYAVRGASNIIVQEVAA